VLSVVHTSLIVADCINSVELCGVNSGRVSTEVSVWYC